MTEMIERVAIALSMADPDERALPEGESMADVYRKLARVAVAAMREPDAQLLGLAADKTQEVRAGGTTWPYSFREGYRRLIDAALNETATTSAA